MYSQKVQRIFVRHCKPNQFASCRQILVKLGNHWWSASPRYSWEPDRFIMEAVLYWILIVQDLFGHTSQSMPHKRISRSPSRLAAVIWRDVWCEQLLTWNDAVYWRHTLLGFMFRSPIIFSVVLQHYRFRIWTFYAIFLGSDHHKHLRNRHNGADKGATQSSWAAHLA